MKTVNSCQFLGPQWDRGRSSLITSAAYSREPRHRRITRGVRDERTVARVFEEFLLVRSILNALGETSPKEIVTISRAHRSEDSRKNRHESLHSTPEEAQEMTRMALDVRGSTKGRTCTDEYRGGSGDATLIL